MCMNGVMIGMVSLTTGGMVIMIMGWQILILKDHGKERLGSAGVEDGILEPEFVESLSGIVDDRTDIILILVFELFVINLLLFHWSGLIEST